MPFYEYECPSCRFYLEVLQKVSDKPVKKCPSCGKTGLKKLISAPVFRLKGSGWYETDFKSDKENKRNLAGGEGEESKSPGDDKGAAKADAKPVGDAKAEGKGDSKADAKGESKPAGESKAGAGKATSGRSGSGRSGSGGSSGSRGKASAVKRAPSRPAPAAKRGAGRSAAAKRGGRSGKRR